MDTVPCPGCAAPMPVEEEVCGGCRRPRDQFEIEKGRDLLREQAARRRRRPLIALAGILALGAGVELFLHRAAALSFASVLLDAVKTAETETPAAVPAAVPAAAPPPAFAPSGPPPAAEAPAPAPAPAAPGSAPAPRAVTPSEPKAPDDPNSLVYGVVFDLLSARAVPGAVVNFGVPGVHIYWSARADGEGRYAIEFPTGTMDNGMTAWVEAPGYRKGQIEDSPKSSYLERSDEDRAQAASELNAADLDPVPIRYPSDAKLLPLDLALIPDRPPAAR